MSGYRSLHRERVDVAVSHGDVGAVWCIASSPLLLTKNVIPPTGSSNNSNTGFRVWVGGSWDGCVRGYVVEESSLAATTAAESGDDGSSSESSPPPRLDASAARLMLTHVLEGARTKQDEVENSQANHRPIAATALSSSSLGCTRVSVVRRYTGQDSEAGNLVVVSLDLAGTLRCWELDANLDATGPTVVEVTSAAAATATATASSSSSASPSSLPIRTIRARHEARLVGACGTSLALPHRLATSAAVEEGGPIVAAVGMLDGTVALVSTGIAHPTPRRHDPATKQQQRGPAVPDIGTLLSSSCARGSAIALSLCFRPTGGGGSSVDLAVGRQDGVVDLVTTTTAGLSSNASAKNHHHRLIRHTSPVRAASYTPDGHLLITGSDEGLVCVWDASRGGVGGGPRQQAGVALVHHLQLNSRSWILNIVPLDDSRRFAVCSQDGTLSIWDLEHPGQVSHTFVAAPSASSSPSSSTTAPHPSTTANPPALTACCSVEGRHRLVAGNDAGYLQLFSIE